MKRFRCRNNNLLIDSIVATPWDRYSSIDASSYTKDVGRRMLQSKYVNVLRCVLDIYVWVRTRAVETRVALTCEFRQLHRHFSEPLELVAPFDSLAWPRARQTVHTFRGTWDGARARASAQMIQTQFNRKFFRKRRHEVIWRSEGSHSEIRSGYSFDTSLTCYHRHRSLVAIQRLAILPHNPKVADVFVSVPPEKFFNSTSK